MGGVVDRRFGGMHYLPWFNLYGGVKRKRGEPSVYQMQRGFDCEILAMYNFLLNSRLFRLISKEGSSIFEEMGNSSSCKKSNEPLVVTDFLDPRLVKALGVIEKEPTEIRLRGEWTDEVFSVDMLLKAVYGVNPAIVRYTSKGIGHSIVLKFDDSGEYTFYDNNPPYNDENAPWYYLKNLHRQYGNDGFLTITQVLMKPGFPIQNATEEEINQELAEEQMPNLQDLHWEIEPQLEIEEARKQRQAFIQKYEAKRKKDLEAIAEGFQGTPPQRTILSMDQDITSIQNLVEHFERTGQLPPPEDLDFDVDSLVELLDDTSLSAAYKAYNLDKNKGNLKKVMKHFNRIRKKRTDDLVPIKMQALSTGDEEGGPSAPETPGPGT